MENNTSANVSESSPESSATLVKSSSQPISAEIFKHLVSESASFRKLSASNDISSTFWPFDMTTEVPKPGLLLGIDAEFVALSASEKGSREDGVEFVKRPARLSLARVSVVRGEGDKAGVCCIDDYICMVTFITAADKEASLRYF
jgi:PAB-dependent poly(A)-specific ribonuclease subunit 2